MSLNNIVKITFNENNEMKLKYNIKTEYKTIK